MPVKRLKKGDQITAEYLNYLADQIDSLEKVKVGPGLTVRRDSSGLSLSLQPTGDDFVGLITNQGPNGEGDYTDSRYWVIQMYSSSVRGTSQYPNNDPTERGYFLQEPANTPYRRILTAVNILETDPGNYSGSHNLQYGQIVQVKGFRDAAATQATQGSLLRYCFWAYRNYGHGIKYQQLTTLDAIGTVGWDFPRFH